MQAKSAPKRSLGGQETDWGHNTSNQYACYHDTMKHHQVAFIPIVPKELLTSSKIPLVKLTFASGEKYPMDVNHLSLDLFTEKFAENRFFPITWGFSVMFFLTPRHFERSTRSLQTKEQFILNSWHAVQVGLCHMISLRVDCELNMLWFLIGTIDMLHHPPLPRTLQSDRTCNTLSLSHMIFLNAKSMIIMIHIEHAVETRRTTFDVKSLMCGFYSSTKSP